MAATVVLVLGCVVALAGDPPAPAAAPARLKKVAVLPFDVAKGMDLQLGATFSGALLGEVRKARGSEVSLMAPDDVVQALPDALRGRLKRCSMATCKAQMAQAVSADRALWGSVSRVGGTVVLNLALLEASDGAQVAQWSGKTPEKELDKLLDQLPASVEVLFPAPKPPPAAEPAPPPPVAVTPLAPPPVAPPPASAPPTPPEVAAILPPDQPTPPVQLLNPPNPRMLTAMQDPEGPAARAAAQQAAQQAQEETGWSKPLIGAGVAVMVPAILLGVLALGGVMAGITLSIASYATARNINAEIKSVPHKNNGAFPLSSLITLGQWLERATFLLLGGGGLLGVLGSVITVAGLVGGIGLIVAANPKVRGAPAAPPPASGSRPASPSSTAAPPAPAPAPGSTP